MLVGKKEGYIQKRGEHHLPDWEESPKYFYLFLFSLLHAYLCTILLLCALKDNIFANIWEIRTWTDWQAIKSPSYKRSSLCIIPQKWGENQKKILSIHSIIRPMKSWRISSCNSLYIEKKHNRFVSSGTLWHASMWPPCVNCWGSQVFLKMKLSS